MGRGREGEREGGEEGRKEKKKERRRYWVEDGRKETQTDAVGWSRKGRNGIEGRL